MAPTRKKDHSEAGKPNDQSSGAASDRSMQADESVEPERTPTVAPKSTSDKDSNITSNTRPVVVVTNSNRGSWYTGGSWRSKAAPVAQVACESISVEQGVSSETSGKDDRRRPSQSVSKSVKGSRKSVPLVAEPTKVHATSDASDKSLPAKTRFHSEEKAKGGESLLVPSSEAKSIVEAKDEIDPSEFDMAQGNDGDALTEDVKSVDTKSLDPRQQNGSWFGWWSRPDGYGSDGERLKSAKRQKLDLSADGASNAPSIDNGTLPANGDHGAQTPRKETEPQSHIDPSTKPEMSMNPASTRSWFGLWSSAQNQQAVPQEDQQNENAVEASNLPQGRATSPDIQSTAVSAIPATSSSDHVDPTKTEERPKASGWAFWSTDKPKDPEEDRNGKSSKQIGELAVADTPSQSHPEVAQFNQQQEANTASANESKRNSSLLRPLRGRAEKVKAGSSDNSGASTPASPHAQTPSLPNAQSPAPPPEVPQANVSVPATGRSKKQHANRPNIVLPTFRETYPPLPSHGYLERFTSYLAQTLHIPGSEVPSPPRHPFISPTPLKVKRAIAIGVHGFFPAALVQRVLGQPTGTSIRFANYAAASIKQWCQDHQPEIKDVEIEKVALEGEGLIADRVATLWKLMLNWLSHLRSADFILVAAHSQGVPVAIMLVAKLIQLGCLSPHVRIGVCAMAGINLGPFVEYKSRLFGATALELFDFCESDSTVSVAYSDALEICLRHNVRVTFVGSLDDQLVSMESSLHAPLTHPYVSRVVFVDGRLHAPNFLTHLVIFAVKLRNLGVSDHGLLREISAPLAGSLVGGEGHSRVYDDPAVYQQAVEFALESTDVSPAAFAPPITPQHAAAIAHSPTSTDPTASPPNAAALARRRASLSTYPTSVSAANLMRRGSTSGVGMVAGAETGIAPIVAPYYDSSGGGSSSLSSAASVAAAAAAAAEKNPFVLPWAVRGMLEEAMVKNDAVMQREVKELVGEFESWRPTSKVLKDVRWRLEGVRSML